MSEEFTPFVFIDPANRPYRVQEWGGKGNLWLFYWNDATQDWVSLRPVRLDELDEMRSMKISDEWAEAYDIAREAAGHL